MSPRLVAGAVIAVAVVGVAAFFVQRAVFSGDDNNGPKPQRYGNVDLEGVAADDVADLHISPPPADYVPRISGGDAFKIAKKDKMLRDVSVKQVLLVHRGPDDEPVSGDLWMISLDPQDPDIFRFPCTSTIIYSLVFIDAETGEVLSAPTKGAPVPGCKRYDINTPVPNKTPDTPDPPPGVTLEP